MKTAPVISMQVAQYPRGNPQLVDKTLEEGGACIFYSRSA